MTSISPAAPHSVIIGLGSNVGTREALLDRATTALAGLGRIARTSPVYETEPLGPSERWFLNQAVELATALEPRQLLAECQTIERELGRVRRPRWAEREIDLDILVYDDLVIDEPGLVIPHPGLSSRRFVLASLADIAPDLRHPVTGRTIRELLDSCVDSLTVRRWKT